MPSATKKKIKKRLKGGRKGKSAKQEPDTVEFVPTGSAFDFLAKKRDPKKRKIKPSAGLTEYALNIPDESSSDDSDYKPKDEDPDDIDVDEESDENGVNSSSGGEDDDESDDNSDLDEEESSQDGLDYLAQLATGSAGGDGKFAKKVLICSVCCGDR